MTTLSEQRVLNIISSVGQRREAQLAMPLPIAGIEGSVDRIGLAAELEERFEIWINDEVADGWRTTTDVVNTVRAELKRRSGGNGG